MVRGRDLGLEFGGTKERQSLPEIRFRCLGMALPLTVFFILGNHYDGNGETSEEGNLKRVQQILQQLREKVIEACKVDRRSNIAVNQGNDCGKKERVGEQPLRPLAPAEQRVASPRWLVELHSLDFSVLYCYKLKSLRHAASCRIAIVPLPAAFSVKRGLQRSCFRRGFLHFLCAVFYLSLISQGHCQCHPATDLKIFQSQTEVVVQNKPQWKVTIVNDCVCTQVSIKLACDGFQTVEEVDSSILAIGDDGCYVNHEQPVYGHQTFNFTYSWGTQYPFMPIYSEIACS
ncbi:hypothetical protein DKX38_010679 [Salix brachista]|uniref:Uncharacterized protein n=1 Tax=Salix brachista TaxID=2182728 RepID=A0A5N5ME98_9ROSI|nr:hypothetical protein DKX38_010679 [Salix brachista]